MQLDGQRFLTRNASLDGSRLDHERTLNGDGVMNWTNCGAVSLALAAVLLGTPALAQDKKILTISSWGGAFQKAQREAWFSRCREGARHHHQGGHTSGIADVRAQVASGRPTWDLTTQGALRAAASSRRKARLETLDPAIVNDCRRAQGAQTDYWISQIVYSVAIGWRDQSLR